MRGKHVVTYGLPFYAGLGLTEDRLSLAARAGAPSISIRLSLRLTCSIRDTAILRPTFRSPRSTCLELIEKMRQAGVRPYHQGGPLPTLG